MNKTHHLAGEHFSVKQRRRNSTRETGSSNHQNPNFISAGFPEKLQYNPEHNARDGRQYKKNDRAQPDHEPRVTRLPVQEPCRHYDRVGECEGLQESPRLAARGVQLLHIPEFGFLSSDRPNDRGEQNDAPVRGQPGGGSGYQDVETEPNFDSNEVRAGG